MVKRPDRFLTACLLVVFSVTVHADGGCGDFWSDLPCDDFTAADVVLKDWGAVYGISHILDDIDEESVWPSGAQIACEFGDQTQIVCASFEGYDATATRLGSEIKADVQYILSLGCLTCGWTHLDGPGGYLIVDLYTQNATIDCDGVCWQNAGPTGSSNSPASASSTPSPWSPTNATDDPQGPHRTGNSDSGTASNHNNGLTPPTTEDLIKIVSTVVGIPTAIGGVITMWKYCRGRR